VVGGGGNVFLNSVASFHIRSADHVVYGIKLQGEVLETSKS
jgi:hypothetical protein